MNKNFILREHSDSFFTELAIQIFRYQAQNNPVYATFIKHLQININEVTSIYQIPFLPISFFKTHSVLSTKKPIETTFLSSGTGGTQSKHHITDIDLYRESFMRSFKYSFGAIQDYILLALLPSYSEQENSSLIFMVNHLINETKNVDSGFYNHDFGQLQKLVLRLEEQNEKKIMLLGVSYALLDFVEVFSGKLKNTLIMETGGMKGKREELIKAELHQKLCKGFGLKQIYSEYGMTELLSQAYSKGKGLFQCPPWMRVLIRDPRNPFNYLEKGRTGGINVIDLANVNSCSFIATQDLGSLENNGLFSIKGRFDDSDIRGCNLLMD